MQNEILDRGTFNATVQLEAKTGDGHLIFIDAQGNLTQYELLEFHVHAPSEHTIGGKSYDFELHIVHKRVYPSDYGEELAVVGVYFDRKEGGDYDNPFIESLNANNVFTNNITNAIEIPLMYTT